MNEEFHPTLYTGDCRDVMISKIQLNSIDLIVTSPPYNCKIPYDSWNDELLYAEYLKFMREWLSIAYNMLKDDGRIAINIYYEISQPGRGGRVMVVSDVWQIMKEIGYQFNGIVRLDEVQSQRTKYCAWGSWMSASAPYIYNPEECVLIACKKVWKKQNRGVSTVGRDEFMENVKGVWSYRAATSTKTKASFSLDIPLKAINILTYAGDTILDPFSGRGTTGAACKILGREYIGIDISENYNEIARGEINRIASKHDIDKLFEFLGTQGVFVTEEKKVRTYIEEHTELIPAITLSTIKLNKTFNPVETELELSMYHDCYTGCGDNLQIDVRRFPAAAYWDTFMELIWSFRECDNESYATKSGGYFMITTDFASPKYKKYNPEIKEL